MRVVVSGGAGFLGSHLCGALLRRGLGLLTPRRGYLATPAVALGLSLVAGWFTVVPAELLGAAAIEAAVLHRAVRRALDAVVGGCAPAVPVQRGRSG
jgi:nucleoside-diphosphate-sugar epimerase